MSKESLIKEPPKRILIPRFDTIGDIILLEGFLEALLEAYPQVEIVLAVQEANLQLKPLFPESIIWLATNINPYGEIDLDNLKLLLNHLDDQHWDLILTTTFNRTYVDESIALTLKDVRNIAIGREKDISWWIKDIWNKLKLSEDTPGYEFVPVEEFSNETNKYQTFWTSLIGKHGRLPRPRSIISDDLANKAKTILINLGLKNKDFYIVAPAGIINVPIKAWTEENFVNVILWMEKENNLRGLLIGHEKEREKIERIANLSKDEGASPLIWLGKDGEIPLLAAITQKAILYLGNDTGAMHIAAAVGIPIVGIFGGGTWPRFLPAGKGVAVVREMPCFGCYWDCIFENAPCLRLVTTKDLKKALSKVLSKQDIGSSCNILHASLPYESICGELISKALQNKHLKNDTIRQKNEIINIKDNIIRSFEADRDVLKNSISWKISKPLRFLERLLKRCGRH